MAAAAPPDPRLLLAVLLLLPPPGPLCAAGPELSRRFTERKRCADPECSSECRAGRCGRRGALLFLRAGQKNAPAGRSLPLGGLRGAGGAGPVAHGMRASVEFRRGGCPFSQPAWGRGLARGWGRAAPSGTLAELILRSKFQSPPAPFLLCSPGIFCTLDNVSPVLYETSFSPSYLILIISPVARFSDVILKCFIKHSIGELTFYLQSYICCYTFISRPGIHPCERSEILFSAN